MILNVPTSFDAVRGIRQGLLLDQRRSCAHGAGMGAAEQDPKGWHLSASQIQHILMNPFYYGEMRIKGKLYPHSYPPLITKELFDQCEEVRLGSSRATATRYSEKPFVFRGLIKCATSRRMVTCDLKKGRHTYLICRDPADPAKKLFIPEERCSIRLSRIQLDPGAADKLLDALLTHMKAGHEAEKQFHHRRDFKRSARL